MKDMFTSFDNPREKSVEAMKASIPAEMREINSKFADSLRDLIGRHPVARL